MSVEPHTLVSTRSVDPVPDSQPVLSSNTHAATINVPAVTPLPPSRPGSPDLRLRGGGKKKGGKEEAAEDPEEEKRAEVPEEEKKRKRPARPLASAQFPELSIGDEIHILRPGL